MELRYVYVRELRTRNETCLPVWYVPDTVLAQVFGVNGIGQELTTHNTLQRTHNPQPNITQYRIVESYQLGSAHPAPSLG